jgi:hypothetical protein
MEYYSEMKELLMYATTWMDPKPGMQGERSQMQFLHVTLFI